MTLKLIAIGILALLGLSSVMKPRAFRIFLGLAVSMALLVGMFVTSNDEADGTSKQNVTGRLLAEVKTFFGHEPDWRKSAEAISERLLNDIQDGKAESSSPLLAEATPPLPLPTKDNLDTSATSPNHTSTGGNANVPATNATSKQNVGRTMIPLQMIPVQINSDSVDQQKVAAVTQLQNRINQYLKWYRQSNPQDPGVERLTHSDLDPDLLRFIQLRSQDGALFFTPVFDERFAVHVRAQGRKHLIRDRMEQTTILVSAAGAVLFLTYGALKVLNARQQARRDDYLTNSNVSLV